LKVLIVDDDALIRDGLKILIDLESDLDVVGTAINGIDALEKCKLFNPDIVLMDIRMPVLDGVLGTKLIKEYSRNIKVVILTTFKDDEYIKEALKNGASGYVLKNQSSDSIIECLRAVAKGNTVFESEIADTISSMLRSEIRKEPSTFNLSEREFDILKLIGEGLSNREISIKLFLSEGTVRNYVTELLEKLEFRDRTQLAIFYLKNF
jgi:DNA-binding NarL/FixJ family response regulator